MQVVDQEGINVGGRSSVMQKMGEKWQKGWRKQAQDKFSKGNIEEAMDLTNPEEEEFEMRVRNGTLPTKAVMYHIRKNKTEDKRAGYRDTMCPRCGEASEVFSVSARVRGNLALAFSSMGLVRTCGHHNLGCGAGNAYLDAITVISHGGALHWLDPSGDGKRVN